MLHGTLMLKFAGKLDCDFHAVPSEAFRALSVGFRPPPANSR